jgi:UTP--glucose-1-phosphate uridylyltransferase
MKINKAIIFAAGFGTRFLPITKTIQKEMLSLLNRPIIDYIVDDCINAGIEEIIFVVNENNNQVKNYYSENLVLKRYLKKMKKPEKYYQIATMHSKAKFSYVIQKESDPYGTAVPLLLAKEHVKNEEAFLVLGGDDFFYNRDGSNEIKKMIETFKLSHAKGLITCIRLPEELVVKYGIAEYREEGGYKFLTDQKEKPKPEEVTSNLATITKFILTPGIFEYIDVNDFDSKSGELYLTTVYTKFARQNNFVIHEPKGEYLDSGSIESWLKANLVIASNNKELWSVIKKFIRDLCDQ